MTADSERYIQLQNVYREQAAQDVATVTQHLHNILQSLGRVSLMFKENGFRNQPTECNEVSWQLIKYANVIKTQSEIFRNKM